MCSFIFLYAISPNWSTIWPITKQRTKNSNIGKINCHACAWACTWAHTHTHTHAYIHTHVRGIVGEQANYTVQIFPQSQQDFVDYDKSLDAGMIVHFARTIQKAVPLWISQHHTVITITVSRHWHCLFVDHRESLNVSLIVEVAKKHRSGKLHYHDYVQILPPPPPTTLT